MVAFQYSPELVPTQEMISFCTRNGSWSPDPAELVCSEPGMVIKYCDSRLISCS